MEIHAKLKNTVLMITHDVDEATLLSDRVVMMTNGPAAGIGETLKVRLERPRRRMELATDVEYMRARAAIWSFSTRGARRPARRLMARERLVVVGNGMAAAGRSRRCWRAIPTAMRSRSSAPNQGELRPHHAVAGAGRREGLRRHRDQRRAWYRDNGVRLLSGVASRPSTRPRRPWSARRCHRALRPLILATGSDPSACACPART